MWFADDLKELDLSTVESVGLVDFNRINKELEGFGLEDKVHYIIDNHGDHGLYGSSLKEKMV